VDAGAPSVTHLDLSDVRYQRIEAEILLSQSRANKPDARPARTKTWPGKELRQSVIGHESPTLSPLVSPDGRHALSANKEKVVRLWRTARVLVAGGFGDGIVRVWDAESGKELRRYEGHTGSVPAWRSSPTAHASSPRHRAYLAGAALTSVRKEPNMTTWLPRCFACLVLLLLFIPVVAADPDKAEIARLIKQLDHDEFEKREEASKE